MKRIILSLAVAAAAVTGADAQLLWTVGGNGAAGTSYLFGTHHVAPVEMLDSLPGFNAAMASVDAVVGEIDMGKSSGEEAQAAMSRWCMAPADSLLTMVLTPAQTDSVNALMERYTGGMLANAVENMAMMKPAMLSTTIAVFQSAKAFPEFRPDAQLDAVIQKRALHQGKEVMALATYDEQFALLMGDPIAWQVDKLMKQVREDGSPKGAEMAHRLADAYRRGDLGLISSIMDDEDMMDPISRERLIDGRNRRWAELLPSIMAEKRILAAVGAGHLPGLIELLRGVGYEVSPVK